MKKLNTFRNIAWGVCSLGALLLASCEDYLEKTPDSNVDEKIVFGNYRNFQGYLDELYGKGLISYYVTGFEFRGRRASISATIPTATRPFPFRTR